MKQQQRLDVPPCCRDLSSAYARSAASAQHVWTSGGLCHGLFPGGTGSHHWPDLHQPKKSLAEFRRQRSAQS